MKLPPMILASASPRRVELLRQLVPRFEVIPSAAPEVHDDRLTARELCLLNAYRKAHSVAKHFPDHLVLGADTLVCLGTLLYGKPADHEEARRMLTELRGRTHLVVTGLCLAHRRTHRSRLVDERTRVTFGRFGPEAIERYLKLVNPLDKAGAYAAQEHAHLIIESIAGSYTNVVGLPVERLRAELRNW